MSGLVEFTRYQAEALLICLGVSLLWAALLLFIARAVERSGSMSSAERLWTATLLFAVLPSIVAPTLATFGISLRPASPPIDFISGAGFAETATESATPSAAPQAVFTMEQAVGAAAILYVYGVFLTFFLWVGQQGCLYYAVARAETVNDARLLRRLEDWAERFDVRMPAIKQSRHVSSVCIVGVMRQAILIPHGISAHVSSDDLVLMCAHELAHVRRGDTRLFTATQLARVIFWFNPLVSGIAARAELAAEESADALVLAKGVDRRVYATCFVEGLKFAATQNQTAPALAPSFTPSDRHGRRRRLHAILSPDARRPTPLATRIMLSAAASTLALIAVGQAALAVDPDSASMRRSVLKDMPLVGDVTLSFGEKRGARDDDAPAHAGLDIKAPKGAKVFAPGDGVVVEATNLYNRAPAWGKVVMIDHGHGLVTRYAHLQDYSVRKGDRVQAGDVIARVGATGEVTGPHLHFETLQDDEPIDPASIVARAPRAPAPAPSAAEAPVSPVKPVVAPTAAPESPAPTWAPTWAPAPPAPPAPKRHSLNGLPTNDLTAPLIAEEFERPGAAGDFPFVAPEIADRTATEFSEPMVFADADGVGAFATMAEDMEMRLLGAQAEDAAGAYEMSVRNGEKIIRLSSREPMSAESRAELRAALQEMQQMREEARREAERRREEWRREQAQIRIEASQASTAAAARGVEMNGEALAEIRRQAQLSRREALELHHEALVEAKEDLDEAIVENFEDTLADLDDAERDLAEAESDLTDAGVSREDIAAMRASIRAQRRQFERDGEARKREIENARRSIERQIASVERQIEKLDETNSDQ